MPPTSPAQPLLHAPQADLIRLLLKQFQRLLAERGASLSNQDVKVMAEAGISAQQAAMLKPALHAIITESLAYLMERWGFTFAQSLATSMDALGGWETTADFLELANDKANHELRISGASALMGLLGDASGVLYLFEVLGAEGNVDDVDSTLARRALAHLAGVDPLRSDWLAQVRQHFAV